MLTHRRLASKSNYPPARPPVRVHQVGEEVAEHLRVVVRHLREWVDCHIGPTFPDWIAETPNSSLYELSNELYLFYKIQRLRCRYYVFLVFPCSQCISQMLRLSTHCGIRFGFQPVGKAITSMSLFPENGSRISILRSPLVMFRVVRPRSEHQQLAAPPDRQQRRQPASAGEGPPHLGCARGSLLTSLVQASVPGCPARVATEPPPLQRPAPSAVARGVPPHSKGVETWPGKNFETKMFVL